MSKKFWNTEKIISFTAILISVFTFFVFLYQTNLIRKEQYISVLPYLELVNYGSGTDNYQLMLINNGIGPAIVTSIKVEGAEGKRYDNIRAYVNEQLSETDTVGFSYTSIYPGRLIPEKEMIALIAVNDHRFDSSNKVYAILNREDLVIEIEFESVYGETWIVDNRKRYPVKQ